MTTHAYISPHAHTSQRITSHAHSLVFTAALCLETAADEEQFAFQQSKRDLQPRQARFAADYRQGFLSSGLFSLSRHPNFFAEQVIWVSFAVFSVCASHTLSVTGLAGAAALLLLFQGSTAFTEEITLSKYPAYAEYQNRTSRLWPWFSPARSRAD